MTGAAAGALALATRSTTSALAGQILPVGAVLPGFECVSTTVDARWQPQPVREAVFGFTTLDLNIDPAQTLQTIDGFGGAFSELGWKALQGLNEQDRDAVLQ